MTGWTDEARAASIAARQKGGEKRTATGEPWDYGKTVGSGSRAVPSNPHPDSAMGRALVKSGQGVQLQLGLSDKQAAAQLANGHPKSGTVPVHSGASGRAVTIHHHPDYGEYRVPNPGEKGKGAGYFTNDRQDALDTARHIHGPHATFKIRSKRYETI